MNNYKGPSFEEEFDPLVEAAKLAARDDTEEGNADCLKLIAAIVLENQEDLTKNCKDTDK